MDVLKLAEGIESLELVHGYPKAYAMYAMGSLGCLFLWASILILAVHSNEIEQTKNSTSIF
jgi:hypothetical protein